MEWRITKELVGYENAVSFMEQRVAAIQSHQQDECVWLLEHPALYTAGTSAKPEDLLSHHFPVYQTGRGGQFTYHGPGQRVGYVMIDLSQRVKDVRRFVEALEQWLINTLSEWGIVGERRSGRVGIWVVTPRGEEKIAALGVRLSKWVSFHGVALNINPDLSHFQGIVPCGLPQFGVTSLAQLGVDVSMEEVDQALQKHWLANDFLATINPVTHAD
jgi:lipoyl(octanoyl) transferase